MSGSKRRKRKQRQKQKTDASLHSEEPTNTMNSQQNKSVLTHEVSKVIEPQSNFGILMSKPKVIYRVFDILQPEWERVIGGMVESAIVDHLKSESEREPQWLGVKCPGDNQFVSPLDGRLFSFDSRSGKVCWSIPPGIALHLSYQSSENDRSYKLFRMDYMPSEPLYLECHAGEFFAKPYKHTDGNIVPSEPVTEIHVNPGMGRRLSPLSSDGVKKLKEATTYSSSEIILSVTRFDYQLTYYKPDTDSVLWYRRIVTFSISRLRDVRARQGQKLLTSGTYPNIKWSAKDGEDTLLGEHNLNVGVICIEKGQSDHDVVKREVSKVRYACNGHPNLLKVYDVVTSHNLHIVSTERRGRSLREFILSPCKDHKILLKLISGIVTVIAHLHDEGIFLGNLDLGDISVDEDYNAKISVITTKTKFPLISSSKGATDDMLALGQVLFFCFTSVEYKGEDLTKPKPEKYLKPIYDCPDALDLLRKLLNKDPTQRRTALQVRNHPLLWDPSRKLEFIQAASDHLQGNNTSVAIGSTTAGIPIDDIRETVFGEEWSGRLDKEFLDAMENDGKRKHVYKYDSMYALLRIIRDLKNHAEKIETQLHSKPDGVPKEVLEIFQPGGTESYFFKRYPKLVMEVYNLMKQHCDENTKIHKLYFK